MNKNHLAILLSISLLGGCSSKAPVASGSPVALASSGPGTTAAASDAPLDEAAKKKIEELKAGVKKNRFDYKERSKTENGPLFLAIAESDPKFLAPALDGLSETYTHYAPNSKKNHPDQRYSAVVLKALDTKDSTELYYALKAACQVMGEKADPEVVTKVVGIVENHNLEGARFEAMDTLFLKKDFLKDPAIYAAFFKKLEDPTAAVQSLALFRFKGNSYGLPDVAKVFEAAHGLMKSKDPGVRGRALEVASETVPDGDKEALAKEIVAALKDQNPYVRSVAASSLARLVKTKAVADIMPLLKDSARNTYDAPYKTLIETRASMHHDGSPWSRVDDAALFAIESATSGTPNKFDYAKINHTNVPGDIAKEVKHATEWFAQNGSKS
jgi:hypothetical protein